MKKSMLFIIVLFILSLAGCTTTLKELKQNPAGQLSFNASQNYKVVYRKSSTYLDNRNFEYGTVKSRIYFDKKIAKHYVRGVRGPHSTVSLACDIEYIEKNKTSVQIYHLWSFNRDDALSLKEAILDENE